MKKTVRSHLSETIDLTESILLFYRVDLALNVSLVKYSFPSKEALESFSENLKPVREEINAMGAKVEVNVEQVWGIKVAGNVTLDMLANGMEGKSN